MRYLSLALLLTFAPLVNSQPYSIAAKKSIAEHRPLLVYVGVPEKRMDGVITVELQAGALTGYPYRCIVLAQPKDGIMYHVHTQTVEEVSRPAVPFDLPKLSVRRDDPLMSAVAGAKLVKYERSKYTQAVSRTAFSYDPIYMVIERVPRESLDKKWRQSGGMEGISDYKSELFGPAEKTKPSLQFISVWNGGFWRHGTDGNGPIVYEDGQPKKSMQQERAWIRSYPDGTRFEDRLTNTKTGKVFELRVAEKKDGKWNRRVEFKDESQRPAGYNGLKVTCSSCHDEAGTGNYAAGLVPGSDTILSDPVPALERE